MYITSKTYHNESNGLEGLMFIPFFLHYIDTLSHGYVKCGPPGMIITKYRHCAKHFTYPKVRVFAVRCGFRLFLALHFVVWFSQNHNCTAPQFCGHMCGAVFKNSLAI